MRPNENNDEVTQGHLVIDGLNGSKVDQWFVKEHSGQHDTYAIHVTVNNLRLVTPNPTLADAFSDLATYLHRIGTLGNGVRLILTTDDLDALADTRQLGIILGYQNSNFIDRNLQLIEVLHLLGVRVLQLTHNTANSYGSGCAEKNDLGLTSLGKDFIDECNRFGILIDCSHSGDRTTIEAAEHSKKPICISHANASAIHRHDRNRSDSAIRSVGANGGVVGAVFLPDFVSASPNPTIGEVADHIMHIVALIGIDGAGFGSDFVLNQDKGRYTALQRHGVQNLSSNNYPLNGLHDMSRLWGELKNRGLSEDGIWKIAGLNFSRLLREGFVSN